MNKITKCFIDLETTGTNPYKHGVWQIAMIIERDGQLQEYNLKTQLLEGDVIDDKASAITGFNKADCEFYDEASKVLKELKGILGLYIDAYDRKDKLFFIAYNAGFDYNFLRQWFYKQGDTYFGSWFWNPFLDCMTIAGHALMEERHKLEDFKLGTVAKYLNIAVVEEEQHDALYDVRLLREIYLAIHNH